MTLTKTLLLLAALAGLAGCGGETIGVGGLGGEELHLDSGDPTTACTGLGVPLNSIETSQGVPNTDYDYGTSPVTCHGFAAQRIEWVHPVRGAYIGLYHEVSATSHQGQLTQITVVLRGASVGSAIIMVNEADDDRDPVGFASSEDTVSIQGSFDWTPYALTFDTASNATYFNVAIIVEDAGTLDIASVEVSSSS